MCVCACVGVVIASVCVYAHVYVCGPQHIPPSLSSTPNLQDRLVLSMEQELVRAHQRATKSHTPISVCAVLLERLLPRSNEQLAPSGDMQNLTVKPPLWEGAIQKTEERFVLIHLPRTQ